MHAWFVKIKNKTTTSKLTWNGPCHAMFTRVTYLRVSTLSYISYIFVATKTGWFDKVCMVENDEKKKKKPFKVGPTA